MPRSSVFVDQDGGWDTTPVRRSYTTVKRYQVPESNSATIDQGQTWRRDNEETKEKIVVRRLHRRDSSHDRQQFQDHTGSRNNIRVVVREREHGPDDHEYWAQREREDHRVKHTTRWRETERDKDGRWSKTIVTRAPSP